MVALIIIVIPISIIMIIILEKRRSGAKAGSLNTCGDLRRDL